MDFNSGVCGLCSINCGFRNLKGKASTGTGSPNAVLANRKIRCIYAVLANKIIRCIYLCSCVFLSRFGRDLNPIRDG